MHFPYLNTLNIFTTVTFMVEKYTIKCTYTDKYTTNRNTNLYSTFPAKFKKTNKKQ